MAKLKLLEKWDWYDEVTIDTELSGAALRVAFRLASNIRDERRPLKRSSENRTESSSFSTETVNGRSQNPERAFAKPRTGVRKTPNGGTCSGAGAAVGVAVMTVAGESIVGLAVGTAVGIGASAGVGTSGSGAGIASDEQLAEKAASATAIDKNIRR